MKPYEPAFKVGDRIRILDRTALESFRRKWKYHHPLQPEQIGFGGNGAAIARIGIYHGGDVIYWLAGLPGVWHEDCLQSEKIDEPEP